MIGVVRDPDVPPELGEIGIEKIWTCMNLNKNATCTTILGDIIVLNQTNY